MADTWLEMNMCGVSAFVAFSENVYVVKLVLQWLFQSVKYGSIIQR